MNVAIIGYGKMGRRIHGVLEERGHCVSLVIDADNTEDLCAEKLAGVDVAIEFTTPATAFGNIVRCLECRVPVVCGTTAWTENMPQVRELCTKYGGGFFYASNYSIGVNVMFRVNSMLARLMNRFGEYDVTVEETHHTQKKDAPSGTAITLAEGIVGELERKNGWVCGMPKPEQLQISAVRRGTVAGIHTVSYESPADVLTLSHNAKDRSGFALGAVLAAEFMSRHPQGIYTMDDLLEF